MIKKDSTLLTQEQKRVLIALKNNPSTFEELCRKCEGIYPSIIRNIVDELNIYSTLTQMYSTNVNEFPFINFDEYYYDKSEILTYNIPNNPVLSSWYFSWNTCLIISRFEQWKNKRILFLGTPRLCEFFLTRKYGEEVVLIDLDDVVMQKLGQKYNSNSIQYIRYYNIDINLLNDQFIENNDLRDFDYVFFDPPWYVDNYVTWLSIARKMVGQNGNIIFSLFPSFVRAEANAERVAILNMCREQATHVNLITGILEYDIPTFEKKELEGQGVYLSSNWKTSDLVIMNSFNERTILGRLPLLEDYKVWKEFDLLNIRWFLNTSISNSQYNNLITKPDGSRILASPSKQYLKKYPINLLSSHGHGLIISDPNQLIAVFDTICSNTTTKHYYDIITELNIDEESKKVLLEIYED